MSIVYLKCDNGHEIALNVSRPAGLLKLCKSGKRVCPDCKPENVHLSPFKPKGESGNFVNDKTYTCKHGHITSLTPFSSGMINVTWGKEFENIPGGPENVPEWIECGTLKCRHETADSRGRKRQCRCKLSALDDSVLAYASSFGIKTKTRVGDVWDKEGCVEPKETHVETFHEHGQEDARLVKTEFSKRNKRRLKDIRKKRQTEAVGEVMTKPTDTKGEKLSKGAAMKGARKDYD